MKKIMILGAAGFIGGNIITYLSQKDYDLYGIDQISIENAPVKQLVKYYQSQLPDPIFHILLGEIKPDIIINCAGRASVPCSMENPLDDFYSGPVLSFEILESIRTITPRTKYIFLSSAAVYGDPQKLPITETDMTKPLSPYGFHKLQSEMICKEYHDVYGIPTLNARIFSAYGAGLRRQVLWDICYKIAFEEKLTLYGTGKESRDFINVNDIARAVELLMLKAPMNGEAYNIANGIEISISEIAAAIISEFKINKKPIFSKNDMPGHPKNWCADIKRLTELGFAAAVSIEQGIHDYIEWFKAEMPVK